MSLLEAASQLLVGELQRVMRDDLVSTVFAPLVELDSGRVAGYEALSYGPARSALEHPELLFAAARNAGRLAELDDMCRAQAVTAARRGGLSCPLTLFVNAVPEALGGAGFAFGELPFHVVVEFSERDLVRQPAQLLRAVAEVRARGWSVALDDVGARQDALELLPLVHADVIKLDLQLLAARPAGVIAAVTGAVRAAAGRGAIVVAMGIETVADEQTAHAFGATLGQGELLGRPVRLP